MYIRLIIGKNKASIIIQELNDIRNLLKQRKNIDKTNDGYGTAFEVFSICVIYGITYEEGIDKYIVHGDRDGKIDAIYYGEFDNIYIYQIKIGDITDNAYNEMQINYDSCMRNCEPDNGKDLFNFIKSHKVVMSQKTLNFRSISNNSKRETNYKPIEIYDMFFTKKLLPLSNNNLTLTIFKPMISDSISYQYNVSTDGNNNFNFYMKAIDLIDYLLASIGVDFIDSDKISVNLSKYFSDNVRGILSVNKKMIYTIENEPENFVKYNNGINITGEVQDLGNQILIKNPIINNGQQTITTLMTVNKNLDKITIPVKITNESDMVIKGKISQFSNEQVKVKAIDMLSLNIYIRNIQSKIFQNTYNDESYFLEIYSSGKKSYDELVKKLYKKNNVIGLLDFIKLYFSVENNKELGLWKNFPNSQIEKMVIQDDFDVNKAFKTCESIARFENYINGIENKKEKADFKSSDLAFKYLLCKENLKEEEAALIIRNINQKYYYKIKENKSKLIDIYKSSTIINKIEKELELYRKNKIYS